MFYIRATLLFLWLCITSTVGFVGCLFFWGNLNLDWFLARAFSWGGLKISGVKLRVQGQEHIEAHQPCIYTGNHQSALDLVSFGAIFPRRTITVGKKELIYIPFFNLFYVAAGNILLDRQKRVKAFAGISKAVGVIKAKKASVWIFPEGTRNKEGVGLLPFKKGAFYMAIGAGVPIVPIVSSSLNDIVSYRKRLFPGGPVTLRVLPPIPTVGMSMDNVDELMNTVREKMLEALRGL